MGLKARQPANNKGADHPAHMHSLISTFVIPYNYRKYDIKTCYERKVSVAEQVGLYLTWPETLKTGNPYMPLFKHKKNHCKMCVHGPGCTYYVRLFLTCADHRCVNFGFPRSWLENCHKLIFD